MTIKEINKHKEVKITVCDKCFRACCLEGKLMCDEAYEAGTVEKTVKELQTLKLEHPSYWGGQITGNFK